MRTPRCHHQLRVSTVCRSRPCDGSSTGGVCNTRIRQATPSWGRCSKSRQSHLLPCRLTCSLHLKCPWFRRRPSSLPRYRHQMFPLLLLLILLPGLGCPRFLHQRRRARLRPTHSARFRRGPRGRSPRWKTTPLPSALPRSRRQMRPLLSVLHPSRRRLFPHPSVLPQSCRRPLALPQCLPQVFPLPSALPQALCQASALLPWALPWALRQVLRT